MRCASVYACAGLNKRGYSEYSSCSTLAPLSKPGALLRYEVEKMDVDQLVKLNSQDLGSDSSNLDDITLAGSEIIKTGGRPTKNIEKLMLSLIVSKILMHLT